MTILALEFSSPQRSVAVLRETNLLAQLSEEAGKKTGLALVEETLRAAGTTPADIDRLAVGLGPGSYAGVRSALAIAQGWQLARNIPAVGVGTMEVLAEAAREAGLRGEFAFAIDAQRNEAYRARCILSGDAAFILEGLAIVPVADLAACGNLAGPEAARWNAAAITLFPKAEHLGVLSSKHEPVPAERLEPVYLRETTFVKAPPARDY